MLEYEHLKQSDLFSTVKINAVSGDTVTVLVHNVKSLPRHVDDILSDNRIINNDSIGFMETQIKPSDSTCKEIETWNLFNISYNNNENKILSLAYGCRNDTAVLNKINANGVSILDFKKHAFCQQSIHFNVRLEKTIHAHAIIFSNVAIFTTNTFHRYYSMGLQLWSFKSVAKWIFWYFHRPCSDGK